MVAHTQPFLTKQTALRPHGIWLTDDELRVLFRYHAASILAELPSTQDELFKMPVAKLTEAIEPHLKRACELFEHLTKQTNQE